MRILVVGLCLLGLAGCITAQNDIQATDSEGRRAFLRYAGAYSPVYLRVANPPKELGDHATVGAAMADAASGAVFGMDTRFTADKGAADQPHFRIVALFDPVISMSTAEICRSEATGADLPAARFADRTKLFLAFCTRGEALAGTRVSGPKLTSVSDPNLRKMARAGISEMFSLNDRDRDRRGAPILGSISVAPDIGFRLNPLEGIW